MKKMFVTGMNMATAKAYVKPRMKVVEVDVQCLNALSDNDDIAGEVGGTDIEDDKIDTESDPFGIKRSFSVFDNLW